MGHQTNVARVTDRQGQLFSLRLWHEQDEDDRITLRGKAQHVLSGETYYFQSWQALQSFLSRQMDCAEISATQHVELGAW